MPKSKQASGSDHDLPEEEPAPAVPPVVHPEPVPVPEPAKPEPAEPEDFGQAPEVHADLPEQPADPTAGRGAQVILDGEAQQAARGGAAPDMAGNLAIKKGLEGRGEVADGSTPDGSTLTGKPAPDVVVAPPADAKPAEPDPAA